MAISFIANALGGTGTTTSFSITLPATQAGDILILEFSHRGTGNGTIGGTYTGPAFTLKHSQLFASSAFSGKTYYSRATGNHTGQTVTGSSLTNSCAAILTIYRGALASGDPLADATVVGEQNASGNETQAQITTATAAAWPVLVVVNSPDLAIATQACTSPGALTERAERLSTGGTDSSIAHASNEKATAGGTGAFTWTQSNAASGSWAYAIKPAPAPTPQAISATAVGVAVLTRNMTYKRSLLATAIVVPIFAQTGMHFRTLSAIAIGVPVLTAANVFLKTIAATTVGVATLSTDLLFTIGMAATTVATVTLSATLVIGQTISATAVGVVALVAEFVAGVPAIVKSIVGFLGGLGRMGRR